MLSVTLGSTTFIFRDTHYVSSTYRWFSTPVFTASIATQTLELQVEVPPCGEGTTFLDKLMVIYDPSANTLPGQVSDPLDPDSDLDGCIDGEVRLKDIFLLQRLQGFRSVVMKVIQVTGIHYRTY